MPRGPRIATCSRAAPRERARHARRGRRRPTRSVARRRSPAVSRSLRATTGLPLRLLEIGTSAGLNLRLDRYWYEQDGVGLGRSATRRCASSTSGRPARPPFESGAVDRRRAAVAIATRSTRRRPGRRRSRSCRTCGPVRTRASTTLRAALDDRGDVPDHRRSGRRGRMGAGAARRTARRARDRRDALGLLAVPLAATRRRRSSRALAAAGARATRRRAARVAAARAVGIGHVARAAPHAVARRRRDACSPRPASTPARSPGWRDRVRRRGRRAVRRARSTARGTADS